jgi:hypothetical protein
MVSLEVIALVLTGLSITASIIYYASILRNANKTRELQIQAQEQALETRKTEIFLRHFGSDTEDHIKTVVEIQKWTWTGYNDWLERYRNDPTNWSKFALNMQRYNGLGLLAMRGQVDLDLVYQYTPMPIIRLWEHFEGVIMKSREEPEFFEHYEGFEYLYNEMKERTEAHMN